MRLPNARADTKCSRRRREEGAFEYNMFEVYIDLDEGTMRIDDVLDGSDTGTQVVAIADFIAEMAKSPPATF